VYSGGTASDTAVSNGYVWLYDSGTTSDTTLGANSVEYLDNEYGTAVSTTISSGGTEVVEGDGVSASFTTVSSGGIEDVYYGTVSATTVSSGGTEVVADAGSAVSTTVDPGGVQYVSYGGTAISTTVNSGGTEFVYSSGTASDTTVGSGDAEIVYSGGSTSYATVSSGGYLVVLPGGTQTSTTVSNGGAIISTGVVVYEPGVGVTSYGSTASDVVVASGGIEYILSGGTADSTTVDAGGTEYVFSGGLASDTLLSDGGTIDVAYLPYVSGGTAVVDASDVLSVTEGDNIYTQRLAGPDQGDTFDLAEDRYGETLTTPCYCAGTLIRTTQGDVPVERLAIGDRLVALAGGSRPVRWIGYRRLDLTRHPTPDRVQPIRIRADAFADGVPQRDLLVSPDHAVLRDGVLIPARLLVNDASIVRDTDFDAVTYYHVELDAHDILLAENLLAESYLDTGNRGMFENAGGPLLLHPDLTNDQARRVAESCMPFADDPERVEKAWRALATRAAQLGWLPPPEPETTEDPALCLLVAGRPIAPVSVLDGRYEFVLPSASAEARLVSRSVVVGKGRPWVADDRRLGVMVRGLTVRSGASMWPIPLDHLAFGEGWWQPEWHGPTLLRRWTNGDALVPMPDAHLTEPGPCVLEIEIAATLSYPLPTAGGSEVAREASGVARAAA
jgi:autotransporter passenger strand-loop-strand repeat protein